MAGSRTKGSSLSQNTLPKTNMDTQNDGLEKVRDPLKMAMFCIYVRFLGCTCIYIYVLSLYTTCLDNFRYNVRKSSLAKPYTTVTSCVVYFVILEGLPCSLHSGGSDGSNVWFALRPRGP